MRHRTPWPAALLVIVLSATSSSGLFAQDAEIAIEEIYASEFAVSFDYLLERIDKSTSYDDSEWGDWTVGCGWLEERFDQDMWRYKRSDGWDEYETSFYPEIDVTIVMDAEKRKIERFTISMADKIGQDEYMYSSVSGHDIPYYQTYKDTLIFGVYGPDIEQHIDEFHGVWDYPRPHPKYGRGLARPRRVRYTDTSCIQFRFKTKPAEKPPLVVFDERLSFYELESKSTAPGELAQPTVHLEFSGVKRQDLDSGPYALVFSTSVDLSGNNELTPPWRVQGDMTIMPFSKPGRAHWKNDQTLAFEIPLYEIVAAITQQNPYAFLSERHFDPTKTPAVPQGTALDVGFRFDKVRARLKHGKEQTTDLTELAFQQARFFYGDEIDLAAHAELRTGQNTESNWQDWTDVILFGVKQVTGLGLAIDAPNAALKLATGSFTDALLSFAPGPVEVVLTLPAGGRIGRDLLDENTVRQVERGLERLGYQDAPLVRHKVTEHYPIWINLQEETIALIDPSGFVHRVKRPANFFVSSPFFTLDQTTNVKRIQGCVSDGVGGFSHWETLPVRPRMALDIVPPAQPFRPVRFKIEGDPQTTETAELRINTRRGGYFVLSEKDGAPGILDFGWEDDGRHLVLKQPYACVVSGQLHIRSFAKRIGAAFYEIEDGQRTLCIPKIELTPTGTEYVVAVDPNGTVVDVNVIAGQVEAVDTARNAVTVLNAGDHHRFEVPSNPNGETLTREHFAAWLPGNTDKDQASITAVQTRQVLVTVGVLLVFLVVFRFVSAVSRFRGVHGTRRRQ